MSNTWLVNVREAVRDYLLFEADSSTSGTGTCALPRTLTTVGGYSFDASWVGRRVKVWDAVAESGATPNDGLYTIAAVGGTANRELTLDRDWPHPGHASTWTCKWGVFSQVYGLINTFYGYSQFGRVPGSPLAPADMPCIAFYGAGEHPIRQNDSGRIEFNYRMALSAATAGTDQAETEKLMGAVIDRLHRGRKQDFRLNRAAAGLSGVTFGPAVFDFLELPKQQRPDGTEAPSLGFYWAASMTIDARILRRVDDLA